MASAILFSHEAEVVRYGGPADHIRDSTLYSADKSTLKPILLRALALTLLASATEEEDMRAVQEAARRMLGEAEGICKKGFRRAGQLWGAGSEGCRDVGRLLAVVYGLKGEEGLRREWEGVVGEKLEGDGGEWLRGGRMVRNMFAVRFGWT